MPHTFSEVIRIFLRLIGLTIPVLVGLSLLAFFWGLTKFIMNAGGDTKSHEEGKAIMKWGLIALFVMVSILGIVRFFYRDLGFSAPFGIPLLPTSHNTNQ